MFEGDNRLNKPSVVLVLRMLGAEVVEDDEFTDPDDLAISAVLPRSAMRVVGQARHGDRRIVAENPGDATFDVAYRCAFTINFSAYADCMDDVRVFSETVARELSAHFVVSWQFEQTLFLNSASGFRAVGQVFAT